MRQKGQRIRPEGPDGPQRLGKGAEKQHRSPHRAHQDKAPELSRSPAEQKQKRGRAHHKAVSPVQQRGEPGGPDPEGAQQIIQQAGGQAQQDGLPEHQQLLGRLPPHPYPKRRLSRPPRLDPWSS